MKRRTTEEWQALFAEQAESGLTVAVFCREHGLNPQYFSIRRKQLLSHQNKAAQAMPAFVPVALHRDSTTMMVQLQWEAVVLHIPGTVSPAWLATLLQGLRA